MDVLMGANLRPDRVIMRARRLPPKVYDEVHDVLERLGGVWSGRDCAYVFAVPYVDRLRAVIGGSMELPMRKTALFGAARTNLVFDVVNESLGIASLPMGSVIFVSGSGLPDVCAAVMSARGDAQIDAGLIDDVDRSVLLERGVRVLGCDWMSIGDSPCYDAVVNVPDITGSANRLSWVQHTAKVIKMLKPGGAFITILPESLLFNVSNREIRKLREMFLQNGAVIQTNPVHSFKEYCQGGATVAIYLGGTVSGQRARDHASMKAKNAESFFAQACAKASLIVPVREHPVEVARINKECADSHRCGLLFPSARKLGDLFDSWGENFDKAPPAGASTCCDANATPLDQFLKVAVRPRVMEAIRCSTVYSVTVGSFQLVSHPESGYTSLYWKYDQIAGGRLIALVETRSLAPIFHLGDVLDRLLD